VTLRCILIGDESLLVHCAQVLRESGHRIEALITDHPDARRWAAESGLPVVSPDDDLDAMLAATPCDWLFSITNFRILSARALATPRCGAINFHDGPLPRYGGRYAPAWALMAGEADYGITWHRMSAEVDQGDILVQRGFSIEPHDTSMSMNVKCWEAAIASFPELLERLAEPALTGTRAPLDQTTWHRKAERPRGLATLDWRRPVAELERQIRALDFGNYPNPLALPKLVGETGVVIVRSVEGIDLERQAAPGTVIGADDGWLEIAARDGMLRLGRLATAEGEPLDPAGALSRLGCQVGDRLPAVPDQLLEQLDAAAAACIRHEESWARRLAELRGPDLPLRTSTVSLPVERSRIALSAGQRGDPLIARFALLVARLTGETEFDLRYREPGVAGAEPVLDRWLADWVPLRVAFSETATVAEAQEQVIQALGRARTGRAFTRDLWSRRPELAEKAGTPLSVEVRTDEPAGPAIAAPLALVLTENGGAVLDYDPARLSAELVEPLARLLDDPAPWSAPAQPWSAVSLLDEPHRLRILNAGNDTARPVGDPQTIHRWIEAQARRTPDATALVFEDQSLTYAALNTRANQVAVKLRTLGVGPEVLVGLCCERSLEMVVGLLGILKAGGAYVPIDPAYPAARIAFMLEDSQAPVLVTQESVLGELPPHRSAVLCLDRDAGQLGALDGEDGPDLATPGNLAYCIYTSGSTGRPKGVMVEHRNVANFFLAMDERLGTTPGVWLAMTSLSFDISVLELWWTLGRGFTVVLHPDERRGEGAIAGLANADRGIDFSLFYFSADEGADQGNRYRLLLEGARFADTNGFTAVWTPERHFHAFGGLYPNPAVTGAAVAAITSRIAVRAGSCVLPLHHPVRVAEEWAVVDNLSGGRTALSVATGWQPDDFILRPENYADVKSRLIESLDQVRRLWRGETLTFDGPRGPVAVRTMPRPIQAELPIWYTTAGNPESYEMAGRLGLNVLTHLLGQSVDELADKITRYRKAWRAAGHAGNGTLTLMLHTFVGEDDAAVKELVRAPMKAYLGTSVSLIKGYAAAFPVFRKTADGRAPELDFTSLSAEEMDALLEFSFERYYETSGLFGTVETCVRMVDRLKGIGVDEVASLIDFGVQPDLVLSHLKFLNRLRLRTGRPRAPAADYSVAAQITRHHVTHLQCTPSRAGLLVADERDRESLRRLQVACIGGEAFPPALATDLHRLIPGDVWNMYGPTETTVWSTMHLVDGAPGPVPLGGPVANTALYVLDRFGHPTLPGVPGELCIGGAGVTRGYYRRPELTAERFVPDLFSGRPGARLYRTGDLARWRDDGGLDFLGRTDFQVKIRGHRIEIGEIEAALRTHPAVREAVVVVRQDPPGDPRLVAYVVPAQPGLEPPALRQHLADRLPQVMWPAAVVLLDALPLTPNGKLDRRALPEPAAPAASRARPAEALPAAGVEETIAAIWRDVLRVASVGVDDNFFDLGGHSLLAVQVHSRLRQEIIGNVAVVDLFRFPTVRTLAAHLTGSSNGTAVSGASDRAGARRAALQRRLARRGAE